MTEQSRVASAIGRRRRDRSLVDVRPDWPDGPLPALVEATVPDLDLAAWLAGNRDTVDELARRHAAVLLRGFAVTGPADFRAAMAALSGDVLSYGERSSPRSEVTEGVYTSTEHPADQPIVLHNEQSYTLNWPLRIVFFCETEPAAGGRTPLADSRRVLARLRPETVAGFERRGGVCYQRNYLPGISLSWQTAFQTDSRAEVEAYCARARIEAQWVGEEQLRTRQVRPAVREHPVTGERTWFNHALFFHVTSLPDEVSAGLRRALAEEDLPYQTAYGDGTPIGADVLAELRAAYAAETRSFPWRRGDVLLVENMLAAHAREPFTPPRRILTAMSDPVTAPELAATAGGRS
ncbi:MULTISPECIES: TauD/TfdA family dioxygenase [unclassified Micromonospora]|jgi:alpha-ketoglutarate-dependent taurine dioxygenase|uniref:TauD/TfdA family dioxygenase n=1 Tax=Micromonospora TaxID=1873 RepID=UPI002415AE31|nr:MULTISPECIES: TauD/TfdA family dioxygenase [unclassified Micromonospora]MDG4819577.1 TauD/TfdA family dioxygenase [Micromonospora sp. WMMD956]WFE56019.1 TauD/TfdA family dioxygenase [Micromonospora sp. WMMD712]